MSATGDEARRLCPWCSEPAADGLTHCPTCGASLAQRETIGDLVIPGVTHVDPNLAQYAADPLRIPGPSPSQSLAGPAVGAVVAGPAGLVALAGLGAVAAAEYLGAGRGRSMTEADREKLGQPSEVALKVIERLEEEERTKASLVEPADEPAGGETTQSA